MTIYEVKISRKYKAGKLERFIDGDFWWDVDVRVNNSYQSDLSECGWARGLNKARAKALKHILGVDKKVGDGEKFGIVINAEGTAEQVRKVLE